MIDLPSIRFEADNPKPIGFVDEVDQAHLTSVGRALISVADAVERVAGRSETVLRVRFCSARYAPTMPFVLYGFHILRVRDEGDFIDEVAEGEETSYALVANHSVEVQRECALLFLYEFVARQQALRNLAKESSEWESRLNGEIALAVSRAEVEFSDRIHGGWLHAAESIAQRAVDAGLGLSVRYEVDVLPTREDVVKRVPHLRAAYNDIGLAREAIDKKVSMIGGSDPRIVAPGLKRAGLDVLQRHLTSMGLRQWMSQTIRDAEVCGNGYLVMPTAEAPTLYALRPEEVEIDESGRYGILRGRTGELVAGKVMHDRGIEQFESPYGISSLEPILAEYQVRMVMTRALETAKSVPDSLRDNVEVTQWAQHMSELAERTLRESDERLEKLLWYPRNWMKDAREGLYFPGQERM